MQLRPVMTFEFIIFDLDDTLYPRHNGLMQEVGLRIQTWLRDHLGLTWEEAIALRHQYFQQYGTTMGGLVAEHDVDVHDYLTFVHDVLVEQYLGPDPVLAAMLRSIPLRKVVYTNATSEYAWRVLRALGVADQFERVIGVEEVGLRNKINRDAYEQMLALLSAQGPECIMVEDSARNLWPARALGLATILVDALPDEAAQRSRHVDYVVGNVLEVGQVVEQIQTLKVSPSDSYRHL